MGNDLNREDLGRRRETDPENSGVFETPAGSKDTTEKDVDMERVKWRERIDTALASFKRIPPNSEK